MRMSYDHHFLTVHCPFLGKQHIQVSGWCSATFILEICGQFGRNLRENAIGQNSDFQQQYKLNEIEHHPEILICCLHNKALSTLKKGGYRTCPTFSFWVVKLVKYRKKLKFMAKLF